MSAFRARQVEWNRTLYRILAIVAVVSFAGFVPPHRARDGRIFLAIGPSTERIEADLRACAVEQYGALGPLGLARTVQFALAPDQAGRATCVRDRLGADGRVDVQDHWIG